MGQPGSWDSRGYNQNILHTPITFSKDNLKILYILKDILTHKDDICTILFFLLKLTTLNIFYELCICTHVPGNMKTKR